MLWAAHSPTYHTAVVTASLQHQEAPLSPHAAASIAAAPPQVPPPQPNPPLHACTPTAAAARAIQLLPLSQASISLLLDRSQCAEETRVDWVWSGRARVGVEECMRASEQAAKRALNRAVRGRSAHLDIEIIGGIDSLRSRCGGPLGKRPSQLELSRCAGVAAGKEAQSKATCSPCEARKRSQNVCNVEP